MIKKYRILLLLFAGLSALFAPHAHAEDEDEELELEEVRNEVSEIMNSDQGAELKFFAMRKLSPEIWKEVERRVTEAPFDALDALEFLSEVYEEYLEISEYSPAYSDTFLKVTKREIMTHTIGDRIIYLKEEEGDRREIAKLEDKLKVELEALFDIKLKMQKQELEELEREVEELREILIRRSKQRTNIIEKRFDELTGVEDPLEW